MRFLLDVVQPFGLRNVDTQSPLFLSPVPDHHKSLPPACSVCDLDLHSKYLFFYSRLPGVYITPLLRPFISPSISTTRRRVPRSFGCILLSKTYFREGAANPQLTAASNDLCFGVQFTQQQFFRASSAAYVSHREPCSSGTVWLCKSGWQGQRIPHETTVS